MLTHIYWIFIIWLATGIIGLISMPFSRLIFRFSSDKGYAFSKIIGWFAVSYITFLTVTLKLLPLSLAVLISAVILWFAFNLYLFLKKREKILPNWRTVIIAEVIFILAFSGLLLVKSFQPEIYQIERFMDFGFIQALRNSTSLPLQDIWLAGANLNYYYFSHFIGFVVLSLTGIDILPGFYLLISLIFALLAVAIFRFAADFTRNIAGFLSIFSTLIAGTWYMVPRLFKGMPSFFYPEPTRVIPGTITEIPIYSFIVAELHAHVWGMLSGILVLAILYSLWREESFKFGVKSPYFWILAFVLGLAFMINSWDALTLGFLSAVVLAIKYWKSNKIKILFYILLLGAIAYLIALPWSFFYKAPVSGIGRVISKSPFLDWLSFWGSLMAIIIAYLFYFFRKKSSSLFPIAVMSTAIFFIILTEFIYMKDILLEGEWYRANTVFKITQQAWLWISVFAGPVFVWLYCSFKKRYARIISIAILAVYVSIGAVYPVIAIQQSSLAGKYITGVGNGLEWWSNKYPDDYQAYLFFDNFKKNLPKNEKMKIIAEAEGDSYTDVSRFSVFLGWPTIVGWPVHEWTWRGSYDEVGKRREEVRKIYTGLDLEDARTILNTYSVNYIIVGQVEKARYGANLRTEKLRQLGNVIFEKGDTFVVEVLANR